MNESQRFCMEGMTGANGETVVHELSVFAEDGAFYDLISAIGIVIEEGVADMLHMDPDLVRPACLQYALHQRDISKSFQHFIVGDGLFSMFSFRIGVE